MRAPCVRQNPCVKLHRRTKNFDNYNLTAKHCYFGCSRSPEIMFCSEVMMINLEALAAHFDFTSFSTRAFYFLAAPVLHLGCFCLDFILL